MNPNCWRTSCAIFTAAVVIGCASDKQASIQTAEEPIAVGAYFPLSISDACQGGGKLSFCTSDAVTRIDSIELSRPAVANVLRMGALSEALRVVGPELVVEAKRAGTTQVTVEASFDDDTKRTASTEIAVEAADRMVLEHRCAVTEPDDDDLFPMHHEVDLTATLYRGQAPLLGEHVESLLDGVGITRQFGSLRSNRYRWTSPGDVTDTRLSSAKFPRFSTMLRTYAPTQVKIQSIEPTYDLSQERPYDSYVALTANLSISGKRPCEFYPIRLETLTPEVCGGAAGAGVWSEDPASLLSVRLRQSGNCQLVATIVGTEIAYPVAFDVKVKAAVDVQGGDAYSDPCRDTDCSNSVAECPDGFELARKDCCNSCQPVPDAVLCGEQRASWDARFASRLVDANHCRFDADCGSTVLIGGCRRYCHVLLNNQEIAPVMTAISEAYYTSCPHCGLAEPAPCEGRPMVYCDQGQCKFAE